MVNEYKKYNFYIMFLDSILILDKSLAEKLDHTANYDLNYLINEKKEISKLFNEELNKDLKERQLTLNKEENKSKIKSNNELFMENAITEEIPETTSELINEELAILNNSKEELKKSENVENFKNEDSNTIVEKNLSLNANIQIDEKDINEIFEENVQSTSGVFLNSTMNSEKLSKGNLFI